MSKPSELGKLRFCPKCGVESLDRDYFPGGESHVRGVRQPKVGVEFICKTCGFGFWISKSRRVVTAEMTFADERKRRAPVKFTEECIGTEISKLYVSANEPPAIKTLKDKVVDKLRSAFR